MGVVQTLEMSPSTMIAADHRELVSRADIHYDGLMPRPEDGLPVGNGRMGGLLWLTPRDIQIQINRPDIFGTNSYTNLPAHGELGYGCGKVSIDFGDDAFADRYVRQHLDLYDAVAELSSNDLKVRCVAWRGGDVIAFRVEDRRDKPQPISIRLQMLREPVVKRGNNSAISRVAEHHGAISLTQVYEEPAANGIREGDHYCSSAIAAAFSGRAGAARLLDERTIELSAPAEKGEFTVLIATAATFGRGQQPDAIALAELSKASPLGFKELAADNLEWWHAFWGKSFLDLHSPDGSAELLEKFRTGWLYNMACCNGGSYPPEWGCMLYYSRGDRYGWSGGRHWWWNLMCNYRGLAAADHLELANPLYSVYSGAYENAHYHAKTVRGCEGIFLSETMTSNGPERLPEPISSELRDFLLEKKTYAETSQEFKDYAKQRNVNESSWCWVDAINGDSASPYSWHAHTFSSGAKIAWQFYRAYEYTLDKSWLKDRAYPMVKGTAEFYRTYPNVRKGDDGRFHIYRVNSHEPLWGANDTHEELCAMRAMLSLAVHCSNVLGVDAHLRGKWKEILDNLAPPPTSDTPNAVGVIKHPSGKATWANGVGPLKPGVRDDIESPTFTRPCVDYDLWTLETDDPQTTEIAARTLESQGWYNDLRNGAATFSISEIPATVVMMGRADEVRAFLAMQLTQKGWRDDLELLPNFVYFQDFDPAHAYATTEGIGYSADNLQNALLQSVAAGPGLDPVIRVFPAWPREWDASFQLAARRGFLVTSSMKKGAIEFVEVRSRLGGECRVRNPWPSRTVRLRRNGKDAKAVGGDLICLPTEKNENLILTVKGTGD